MTGGLEAAPAGFPGIGIAAKGPSSRRETAHGPLFPDLPVLATAGCACELVYAAFCFRLAASCCRRRKARISAMDIAGSLNAGSSAQVEAL